MKQRAESAITNKTTERESGNNTKGFIQFLSWAINQVERDIKSATRRFLNVAP